MRPHTAIGGTNLELELLLAIVLIGYPESRRVWSTGTVAQRWSAKTHHKRPDIDGSSLNSTTNY